MAKTKEEKLQAKEEKKKIKEAKKEEKKSKKKKKVKTDTKEIKDLTAVKDDSTEEAFEKVKEKKSIFNFFLILILFITICSSIYTIYSLTLLDSIENTLRYIAMGVIAFIDLLLILKVFLKSKKKKKRKKKIGTMIFMIFFTIICIAVSILINFIYNEISKINKDVVTYSSSLVTMATNSAQKISDVKNFKIAILDDEKSPEGYIIPQEIVSEHNLNDENQLIKYSDYSTMVVDLYADEIDAMLISSNYVEMFEVITGYENIATDTKVIISKDKDMKKTETSQKEIASANKSVTEPFTMLLMGIDSTAEVLTKNAIANGDTLILLTFNPKTLNATMVSIPRDSYLPIACWPGKDENKITHAAAYGNDCMMNTIQDFFGVNIDYYAKINFKGLVKLVDAVGGVEVDVPHTLCTDNSNREGDVCIHAGRQVLNGEQALTFARNRKALVNGDFGRAEHQQEIIMALINKMRTITEVSKFRTILNTVSNSLDTNLTTKQILEFYNVGKDIIKRSSEQSDLINIQQMFLSGASQMIYDERMRMVLYNYVPNTRSRDAIVQAMKENLELAPHKNITEFSFSINKTYEKTVIGKGFATAGTYSLLPSFIGLSKTQAAARAESLGLNYEFVGDGETVIDQSYPEKKRIDKIGKNKLVLTLNKKVVIEEDDDDDEDEEEKEDSDKDTSKEDKPTTETPKTEEPSTPSTSTETE